MIVVCAFVALCVASAAATERHVPGEYATIQAAIDACVAGDEVIIADGTYTGTGNKNLDFKGLAITIRSASGDPATCIIDCEGSGRGFYFHSGETAESGVRGLTIQNGNVTTMTPGVVAVSIATPQSDPDHLCDRGQRGELGWRSVLLLWHADAERLRHCGQRDNVHIRYRRGVVR
jgi:hypothetical protein